MRVALYEDQQAVAFGPLTMLRPVFELVCGARSVRERLLRDVPDCEWGVLIRDSLAASYLEEHPTARVNDRDWLAQADTCLINGRWFPERPCDWRAIANDEVAVCQGEVVSLTVNTAELAGWDQLSDSSALQRIAGKRRARQVAGWVAKHPWDLVEANGIQLERDFQRPATPFDSGKNASAIMVLGDPWRLAVHPTAELQPCVVLDVRQGPITIDADARIQSFTQITGPCHVGPGSHLLQAIVKSGTTIGPECRVAGEVHQTILHGFVNKAHDGFLGHSYVCPWVNLGAGTTTSNLKIDYSDVGVPIMGDVIDSGKMKVGAFIGDHAKTGLGSLFNTGTSVGVCAMILPAGKLLPKYVPPFGRVWYGQLTDRSEVEALLETARLVMSRRGKQLTATNAALLKNMFAATWIDRKRGIADAQRQAAQHTQRRAG